MYRYTAYRSFTWWIYGKLKRKLRKVIPACAVASIRECFPEPDGIYEGFHGAVSDFLENEIWILALCHTVKILIAQIILQKPAVNDLMKSLNWKDVNQQWEHNILLMTFKCLSDTVPEYLTKFYKLIDAYHNVNTRSKLKNILVLPQWQNDIGKRTFKYRSVKLWNNLPSALRCNIHSLSLQSFKNLI